MTQTRLRSMALLSPVLAFAVLAASLDAASAAPCRESANAKALDFWIGDWRVTDLDRTQEYGTNLIESALSGCAIFEHWASAEGGEGKSLFYFDSKADRWSQVWVTEDTARLGGLKLKYQRQGEVPSGVRFQGVLEGPDGEILDRTTLTPLGDGTVRQTIEISRDGGESWKAVFDVLYAPVAGG